VLVIISSFLNFPAYSQEAEDSQIFITGFNAYQQKDYATTINKMNEVLQKYPDSPLRDMVLFWLSRSYYKSGNQQDAARVMSQFSREYPDNPLKGTVDEELLSLTARYDKGEQLSRGAVTTTDADRAAAARNAEIEKNRLAREQAEKALRAQEQAERDRIASAKAEADRVAAAETARLTAQKIAEERKSAERVEQQRLAAVKEAEGRKSAENVEKQRLDREQAEQVRVATLRKEQERLAALKAEEERTTREKAADAKRLIEAAEHQKLASLKAEEERKAAEKLSAERNTLEKAEHERLVTQQDEMVRLALAKSEQKRLLAEKTIVERDAAEKAEKAQQYRAVVAQAEQDRTAAEAEEKRLAALKAETERVAAQKADLLRVERERAEKELAAVEAVETARLANVQKELERTAAARAEAERLAQEKSALAKRAATEAEQKKLAALKQEQERTAAEMAEKERLAVAAAEQAQRTPAGQVSPPRQSDLPVAEPEAVKAVPVKAADEQLQAQQREADAKGRAAKADLREKAIAQYKSILVSYPNSKAAAAAAGKLKELGVAVALPAATPEPSSETAQVLRFEVAQFAGLEFNLLSQQQAYNVAQRISIPFEITNQGNGSDSFYLESGFPSEFSAGFTSATAPAQAINQTRVLAPGETFKGFVQLTIPSASIDGLRITHPVKAASRTVTEATQSREVRIIAAAPLLRATVKADRVNPLPGEKITYRVAVLNVGSTGAQDVSFRLNYPPQLEPTDMAASGFRQEMKSALVIDGLQLKSGESREFNLAFQLKDGTLAGQEILTRAELHNNQLKTTAGFVSTAVYVQPQHGLQVHAGSDRLVVIPGQKISVPFVVTNTGNVREKFAVVTGSKGAQAAAIFQDLNRDGVRQASEPVITEIGPLAAKEEVSIVVEIQTPREAIDGSEDSAQISFSSAGDASRSFTGVTRLIYSRPVLQMAMSGRDGKLKPGEVASFDLTVTNRGSNLARTVELQSAWPEQLELVAADPTVHSVSNGTLFWKFKELGAAEKRVIKVSFRVKPGMGMGTNIQVINILTYEDQIGNRY
jgi:hypothetical protein